MAHRYIPILALGILFSSALFFLLQGREPQVCELPPSHDRSIELVDPPNQAAPLRPLSALDNQEKFIEELGALPEGERVLVALTVAMRQNKIPYLRHTVNSYLAAGTNEKLKGMFDIVIFIVERDPEKAESIDNMIRLVWKDEVSSKRIRILRRSTEFKSCDERFPSSDPETNGSVQYWLVEELYSRDGVCQLHKMMPKVSFTHNMWMSQLCTDVAFMLDYTVSLGGYNYVLQAEDDASVDSRWLSIMLRYAANITRRKGEDWGVLRFVWRGEQGNTQEKLLNYGIPYGFGLLYNRKVIPNFVRFVYKFPSWQPIDFVIGLYMYENHTIWQAPFNLYIHHGVMSSGRKLRGDPPPRINLNMTEIPDDFYPNGWGECEIMAAIREREDGPKMSLTL